MFLPRFWLLGSICLHSLCAATQVPRHDPPGQLFRRAPMAQSARSIAVSLATNLHYAFDAELCRVHTIWAGSPLNLWGPPYSGQKSPFICDFTGKALLSTPKLPPWAAGGKAVIPQFLAIQNSSPSVSFQYKVGDLVITESMRGAGEGSAATVVRSFRIPPRAEPLRYLAFAEMGARVAADGAKAELASSNGPINFSISSGASAESTTEQVDYTEEIITNEGTEKGNPQVRVQGLQSRLYLNIPPSQNETVLELTISFPGLPPIPAPVAAPAPMTFTASTDRRRPAGDAAYRIEHFPLPPEAELIITGMDWLPSGDLAVCTWLGEIYLIRNHSAEPSAATYHRFARGLIEPLGLAVHEGNIVVVQKGELTRVRDTDNDGEADRFECLSAGWGFSGNYHSYSFGPLVTPRGSFVVFTTGQRARYDLPYQGWALEFSKESGMLAPIASGLRVPHGWAMFENDIFVADNQGNWIGTCRLNHIQPGKFYGFPSSTPAPRRAHPSPDEVEPPAVWLPRNLSPSASGIEPIQTENFGPFKGQMLVGDFQNATVLRVSLEQVNGRWQGVVFPFARGFLSGVNRLKFSASGALYVGGGKRTWSTAAPREYSLDRVSFTGQTPFEVQSVHVLPEGFELKFTKAVAREDAEDLENYDVKQFTYKYHQEYGSPEFDHNGQPGASSVELVSATLTSPVTVRLVLSGLKPGFVTAFRSAVLSAEGEDLRHDAFYYTLTEIPRP